MSDRPVLLPLPVLARHLDVPEFMFCDLPPARRGGEARPALYDLVGAKMYLRQRGVIFVNGEAVLIR